MRTLLVYPPATDPAHPPLGLPSLVAYLRHHGKEVRQVDLNIRSYHWLLDPDHLEECVARLEARRDELEACQHLEPALAEEYRRVMVSLLSADMLLDEAPDLLDRLRQPWTYADIRRYRGASSLLRRTMELVSVAHHPTRWYPRSLLLGYLPTRSSDVRAAAADRQRNPFLAFFEALLPELTEDAPELVGLSVSCYAQLIPAMTLAGLLRERLPMSRVVVGGGLISFFSDDWSRLGALGDLVDAFVPFEGELPLLRLVERMEHEQPLAGAPGTLALDGSGMSLTPPEDPPSPNQLPCPDFSDLPLDTYLSPHLTLPLLSGRGCYWGRCTFCSHDHLFRGSYRAGRPLRVAGQMEALARAHGARCFYLTDECIPPASARAIARVLRAKGLDLGWFGEMRLEECLDEEAAAELAAGGCRMLLFGLESGSQRVLELMQKGLELDAVAGVLDACTRAGIRTYLMLFFGFPGESRPEAEDTIRLIETLGRTIDQVTCTSFVLEHQTEVFNHAHHYGIEVLGNPPEEDLKTFSSYTLEAGLGPDEASAMVAEARAQPPVQERSQRDLVSRSHLVHLPRGCEPGRTIGLMAIPAWPESEDLGRIVLRRFPDLVGLTLPFNLDELDARADACAGPESTAESTAESVTESVRTPEVEPEASGLDRCETRYVFSARLGRMLDVGDDGWLLLKPCNGRFPLGDILEAVGERNRETARTFYRRLAEVGVLTWDRL